MAADCADSASYDIPLPLLPPLVIDGPVRECDGENQKKGDVEKGRVANFRGLEAYSKELGTLICANPR